MLSALREGQEPRTIQLELQDGSTILGTSFGANKSVSGELVFQTGMVGYVESLTDPSYRGQILILTFPLVGNYGVPSRKAADVLLDGIPAYFESKDIHVAGLIVASYSGQNYSHFLARSSLGAWLRENGVPALQGVDTRALTKHIRETGSMLGRLLLLDQHVALHSSTNDCSKSARLQHGTSRERQEVPWFNPGESNLVSEGEYLIE